MKTKRIYKASYKTSSNTYNLTPYEYTSKKEAISSIRKIGIGTTSVGSHCHVWVWYDYQTLSNGILPIYVYDKQLKA